MSRVSYIVCWVCIKGLLLTTAAKLENLDVSCSVAILFYLISSFLVIISWYCCLEFCRSSYSYFTVVFRFMALICY